MRPETMEIFEGLRHEKLRDGQLLPILAGPHHVHFPETMVRAAGAIAYHEVSRYEDELVMLPATATPMAKSSVVTLDSGEGVICHVIRQFADGLVAIDHVGRSFVNPVGGFYPGSSKFAQVDRKWLPYDLRRDFQCLEGVAGKGYLFELAILFSLANEPSRVIKTKVKATRADRRRMQRRHGVAATEWTDVNWTLGRKVAAKGGDVTEEGHRKALHWCRAYWRRAAPSDPKSQWVYLPLRGGWGWFTHIPDGWRGHPDYGIKLQRHRPHMPGDAPERAPAADCRAVPQAKLEAMSLAQRQALVQAGYAPTAVLQ